tara:strand:- start:86887 stop:87312 length:426 start_codon:yes stop_codon:yes gene_type:complete
MKTKIKNELVLAMKAKNKERISTLRLMTVKIDEKIRETNSDKDLVAVLDSMIKERLKTIELCGEARPDMAEAEQREIEVISEFLPKRMNLDEIKVVVNGAIETLNASTIRDMGKVIGFVKNECGDTAKPSDIAQVVKSCLV